MIYKKIQICGSATTLIVQKILTETNLFQSSDEQDISDLALFACAPLYLDSVSFKSDFKTHKWIKLDWQTFSQLCFYSESNHEYLENLKGAKYDIKRNLELGFENNMIKNYKTFDYIKNDSQTHGIGVASVYIPVA